MFPGVAPRAIRETEEIPAYELTIAKGGLKIKPSRNLATDHPATGTEPGTRTRAGGSSCRRSAGEADGKLSYS
jgi:uncharacterized protein (TIGR03435 family)